jgi:5-methyltetrahydropteroyltriglutamate--homocysteine methyltransferase
MEPFETTHTGSLPRPPALTEALYDREDRKATPGIDVRIREAVVDTVRRQVDAGIDVVNDGEMGKIGYSTYVKDRLTGFELVPEAERSPFTSTSEFPDFEPPIRASRSIAYIRNAACTGPVRPKDLAAVETDVASLKAAAEAAGARELFMSAASPGVISFFIPDHHYGNREAYLADIADAMRGEYRAIVDAGITLQLDCPDLAMAGARFPSLDEFRRFAAINVEALNHATQDLPADRLRMHICWGNTEAPHNHDVELAKIVDIVLTARPAGISVEACNPRHGHEWRVFEEVSLPDDRYLIPGVIDSTTNFIEHPDLVAERLLNYARVVGQERVLAGSDCGFATFAGLGAVAPSIVWAKLASMAEGARRARSRLT